MSRPYNLLDVSPARFSQDGMVKTVRPSAS